ncbi:MAG: hypothetical protein AAF940_03015 [Pseudomonadota bacterium]
MSHRQRSLTATIAFTGLFFGTLAAQAGPVSLATKPHVQPVAAYDPVGADVHRIGYSHQSSRKSEPFDRFGRFGQEARNYERRQRLGLEPRIQGKFSTPLFFLPGGSKKKQ